MTLIEKILQELNKLSSFIAKIKKLSKSEIISLGKKFKAISKGTKKLKNVNIDEIMDSIINIFNEIPDIKEREKAYRKLDEVEILFDEILEKLDFFEPESEYKPSTESKNSDKEKETVTEKKSVNKYLVEDTEESDDEFFADYLEEMLELAEELEAETLNLSKSPTNKEIIHKVFRIFHTIKGNSGIMRHSALRVLAHSTENILDLARDSKLIFSEKMIHTILISYDLISSIIKNFSENQKDEIYDKNIYDKQLLKLSEIVELNDDSVKTENSDTIDNTELENDFFIEDSVTQVRQSDTIRISTNKLDSLIDMIGELVITTNFIKQDKIVRNRENIELINKVFQLSSVVNELQKSSTSFRMIPIERTLKKMKRVVHEYNSNHTKRIELQLKGVETEIDRSLVNRLYEPLVHIIRNCCDHGIEEKDDRLKQGKSAEGNIEIKAFYKGDSVVIDIQDDGRGLDKDKILKKAIEQKIINSDENLSEEDTFKLIMQPGFSTAHKVTSVSGRGVGMDIVNQAIKDMAGRIEITSQKGEGTLIRLFLPLTLLMMEGMLVKIGAELFVIPVNKIQRIFKPSLNDINHLMNKGEILKLGERILPIIRLHEVLEIHDNVKDIDEGVLIIIQGIHKDFALLIDELLSIQDVIVKKLNKAINSYNLFSGSTILGDGSVGLIIDTNNLEDL